MLIADELRLVARSRGIFAVPTPAGTQGQVLLASLGLDLLDPHVVIELLRLSCVGEIPLARVDQDATSSSLRERDVKLPAASVSDGLMTYEALVLEAVPVTANTLITEQIATVWRAGCDEGVHGNPDIMYIATVATNAYADHSVAEQQQARAQCAAFWNRIAGITSTQSTP